jgi:hypothetical protein
MGLGLIVAVVLFGLAVGSNAPQHIPFRAQTAEQFFAVLTHCLAWPWIDLPVCGLIMQLPLIWLVVDRRWQREPLDAAELCAVALGLFALLQAAAIAFSRGAVLPGFRPLSRYQDPLLLGVADQLFAVLRNFVRGSRLVRIAGIVCCGAAAGLIVLTETNFTLHLPFKRAQDRANLAIVRAYASSGNSIEFSRNPNFSGPHPDRRVVQRVLDNPALRAVLPREVLNPSAAGLPWGVRWSPALTAASGALLFAQLTIFLRSKSNRSDQLMPP